MICNHCKEEISKTDIELNIVNPDTGNLVCYDCWASLL